MSDIDEPHRDEGANVRPRGVRRRQVLRALAGVAIGGPMAAAAYSVGFEPHWLQVVRRDLPIAELDDAAVGKTLAMVSDLHVGPFVDDAYLRDAMRRVAAMEPDMAVITGDLITWRDNHEIERAGEIVAELGKPPLGAFATLGNHDYGPLRQQPELAAALGRELDRRDVVMLRNAYADTAGLRVAGMDDLWSGRFDASLVSPALRGGRSAIALCHNPDSADAEGWGDYRGWVLSGHTHGGQVCVPLGSPPILPVENPDYVAGEVAAPGGRRVYINRGLGHLYRLRFNARPEITIFRLTRA